MMGWVKLAVKITEFWDQHKGLRKFMRGRETVYQINWILTGWGVRQVGRNYTNSHARFLLPFLWVASVTLTIIQLFDVIYQFPRSMASFTPCQTSSVLHGHNTQVFLQTFEDRILILVTQMGKVGSLVFMPQFPYFVIRLSTKLLVPGYFAWYRLSHPIQRIGSKSFATRTLSCHPIDTLIRKRSFWTSADSVCPIRISNRHNLLEARITKRFGI
jgi:hypothetical protein